MIFWLDYSLRSKINPFKLNGISHCYQLDQSISILRGVGWYFFPFFFQILIKHSVSKQCRPDQAPQNVASALGLHCLRMSHKKDARLIWV